MTAAVGMDLGAEMEAGGQAGKGQGSVAAGRLGKELNTNWLQPASGNPATGLASEAPSFRSSWQAQVNAWRGVSRGTNGVESEAASEATTVDMASGAAMSRAAKPEQASVSAQGSNSSLPSKAAVAQQQVSIPDVADQKQTWPQKSHFAAETTDNAGTKTKLAESVDVTTTERPGRANRSRVSSLTPPAERKNTVEATNASAQAIAPTIEAPIQIPAVPVRSQIPTLAETAEAISESGSKFAPSHWRSTQSSGLAQLSGSTQLSGQQFSSAEQIAGAEASKFATGDPGSGTSAGVQAHTVHTGPATIPHNATGSEATHQAAASSLDDADEPALGQPSTSLSSPDARSLESRHEPSIAQTPATDAKLSGQSVPTSSAGNLNQTSVENIAPFAAPLVNVPGAIQASADTVRDSSKQFTDRATTRATNRDATGKSVPGATQVSLAQPAGVDAVASSGLRIPGAAQISTAPAPHDQPVATAASAATTTQNTFAALDAGNSPGTPAWTHAGNQHAEAGFRDPSLGWVSVRADVDAGGIHATLVPSSAEAAQALNGHLAGLSTHLVEQQSPVASLTMAEPSDSGVESGMGQRMQRGAEGNPQGNAPEEAQAGSQDNAAPAASTSGLSTPAQAGIRDSFTHTGDLRGTHISVMA